MNAMIEMLEGREMFSVSVAGESAPVTVEQQPVVVADASKVKVDHSNLTPIKVIDKASPK